MSLDQTNRTLRVMPALREGRGWPCWWSFQLAGGKDATPRDHNRDRGAEPVYPEVAAAQRMIREIQARHVLDVFIDLHNPTHDAPIFFNGPFGFDRLSGSQQRNYQRWIDLAASNMTSPFKVQPKYRFANYVKSEEERGRMSSGWVRANAAPYTLRCFSGPPRRMNPVALMSISPKPITIRPSC